MHSLDSSLSCAPVFLLSSSVWFFCVCVWTLKCTFPSPRPLPQPSPLFVLTVLEISHVLYFDWHMLTTCRQLLDPKASTPSPRVCRHTHTGQRVRSARVTKTRASPSSHCDASVTLNCTPVCNHGLKPPLSTDLRLVHVSMPRKITLCTQFN